MLDGAIQMRYNNTNFTTAGAPAVGKHLLLAKVEIDVSGTNDRLSFWFDPDLSSGEAGLGTPTYTDDTADTFGTSIDGIGVLLADRNFDGSVYTTDPDTALENAELIDAILVGTTFVDVIPQLSQSEVIATEYFNGYGTSEIVSDGDNLKGGSGWSSAWHVGGRELRACHQSLLHGHRLRQLGQPQRLRRRGDGLHGQPADAQRLHRHPGARDPGNHRLVQRPDLDR